MLTNLKEEGCENQKRDGDNQGKNEQNTCEREKRWKIEDPFPSPTFACPVAF